jgi:hypothetical protein
MLLLAFRLSRDGTDVMKIHAPFHPRGGSLLWFGNGRQGARDFMVFIKNLPHRTRGTRQFRTLIDQRLFFAQVIHNRQGTRHTPQWLWRVIANIENLVHHFFGY